MNERAPPAPGQEPIPVPRPCAGPAPDVAAVREALRAALAAVAPQADVTALRADRPLRAQLDLDSMDWLNVVLGLRERLGRDVPESDDGRPWSLDALAARLAGGPGAASPDDGAPRDGHGDGHAPPPREPATTRHRLDGTDVVVRPLRAEDAALDADFVRGLSADARYKRFMVTMRELPPGDLRALTGVDQDRQVALAAVVERDGAPAIVGVARYARLAEEGACEFAVAVGDAWQHVGLAGVLMARLMSHARARGLARMEGLVLAANRPMRDFARQLGFRIEPAPDDPGTVRVVRDL